MPTKATIPATAGLGRFLPNPKLKLREQLAEVCRFRQMSHRTENAYWHWIKGFIQFHRTKGVTSAQASPKFKTLTRPAATLSHPMGEGQGAEREKGWRHPRELGAAEAQAYLSHLVTARDVAAATQRQALNAIVFLYRAVLNVELGLIGEIEKPQRPVKLPTVLTKEEVRRVLAAVTPEHQLACQLLYGTGMRLLECLRLRVKDLDFGRNEIVIHDGKGAQDRVTMLPESLKPALRVHLERVKAQHEKDLAEGHGRVSLPHALARKFQMADRQWCWQFVFGGGGDGEGSADRGMVPASCA